MSKDKKVIIIYADCLDGCCGYTEEEYDEEYHLIRLEEGLVELKGVKDIFYFFGFKNE